MTADGGHSGSLPFGDIRFNEQVNDFDEQRKYTGHEHDDSTDLTYMNARYYTGAGAKFASQDPVFLLTGDPLLEDKIGMSLQDYLSDPQGLNAYSYVKNRPLVYVDPTGESWREAWRIGYGSWSARNYIRHGGLNLSVGDSNIRGVSKIYSHAKRYSKGDPLVSLSVASLSVKTNSTSESNHDRVMRVLKLPSGLFGEYSLQAEGDHTDKLQHFFSSALLSYMTNETITDLAGVGVEVIEDVTRISNFDMNDVKANQLGIEFGQLLSGDPNASLVNFLENNDTVENRNKLGTKVNN